MTDELGDVDADKKIKTMTVRFAEPVGREWAHSLANHLENAATSFGDYSIEVDLPDDDEVPGVAPLRYVYFVSFALAQGSGFGNAEVISPCEITAIADVTSISAMLASGMLFDVSIMYFQLLRIEDAVEGNPGG